MSSLLIRAEDWDKMAQSGRDPLPVRAAELLVVLARAREAERELQACLDQLRAVLAASD